MADKGRYTAPLLAALVIALAPQVIRLPLWITAWCLALWGYALISVKRQWSPPGGSVRRVMTLCGVAGGLATYGFAFDLDAGVGLLAIMVGLKPLEIRSHRDRMMTVFLTYFLVITNLLYTNALVMTLYMGASVLFTTAVLAKINHPGGQLRKEFRVSAKIMVQALPWMVLFFVFFPRIHGSLWGSPLHGRGQTGFADHIEPGSIAQLVRSSEIAFRAEFSGGIPRPDRLYWRGLVFQHFDGIRWQRGVAAPRGAEPISGNDPVAYTITLEPHGRRWMFALDLPYASQRPARIRADHTLSSWRRIHGRIRYSATSYTTYRTGPMRTWEAAALTLPASGNPKARTLAGQWAAAADSPQEIVDAALAFFREKKFYYSLNAPLLGADRIDDFLFRTRSGYCEHYASAFAFLMRAAHIPARLIGGYLGGEVNPFGNYLIVRQSDAHAWAEVRLPDRGWVRVDPTSAVAPARVASGAAAALAPEERAALLGFSRFGPLSGLWKKVGLGLDMVNNQWNRWILGYSYFRQQALFARFGIKSGSLAWPVLGTLGVTAAGCLMLIGVVAINRRRTYQTGDRVQRAYRRFCTKLSGVGLPRAPAEGPVDYALSVVSRRPDLADPVRAITDQYVRIRYADQGDGAAVKSLLADVARFRPPKMPNHHP